MSRPEWESALARPGIAPVPMTSPAPDASRDQWTDLRSRAHAPSVADAHGRRRPVRLLRVHRRHDPADYRGRASVGSPSTPESRRRSWSDRRRAPRLAPPWYRAADCPAHTALPPALLGFWLSSLFMAAPLAAPARDACACWDRADHVPPDFRRISELRCASVNHSIQSEEDYERQV